MKLVIFEGPDMCGKTTQAELLFKNEKLKNVLYFHFPMLTKELDGDRVSKSFADTTTYLYTSTPDLFPKEKVMDVIYENIDANSRNKKLFLDLIEEFRLRYFKRTNLLFANAVGVKINGKIINPTDLTDTLQYFPLLNMDLNPKEFTIIMDRFYLSGDVYNAIVPMRAALISRKDFSKDDLNHILKIELGNSLTITNRLNSIFGSANITQFIFQHSEIIKKAVESNMRVKDDYDNNILMNAVATQFYDTFKENRDIKLFNKTSMIECDIYEAVREFYYSGTFVYMNTDNFAKEHKITDSKALIESISKQIYAYHDFDSVNMTSTIVIR